MRPWWQRWMCIGATVLVLVIAVAPSVRAVWVNWWRLGREWERYFWYLPALWIWGWCSLMAVALPLGGALRCLPLQRAEDVRARVLAGLLGMYAAVSVGTAVFWQLAAWVSFPLLKRGEVRMIPLWPWPDWRFFREYLALWFLG